MVEQPESCHMEVWHTTGDNMMGGPVKAWRCVTHGVSREYDDVHVRMIVDVRAHWRDVEHADGDG